MVPSSSSSSIHSSCSSVTLVAADETPTAEDSRAETARRKKKRKRGPQLYSIKKERAVEFNLTLDINNLRQEISALQARQQLLTALQLRSVSTCSASTNHSMTSLSLISSSLQSGRQRELDDGFFVRVVREYFRAFAQGAKLVNREQQLGFLTNIMSTHVICGNQPLDANEWWAQHYAYESVLPLLAIHAIQSIQFLRMDSDTLVKVHGSFRAIITRTTLERVFPHVLGFEHIVARLVGRASDWQCTWEFMFDPDGKVKKYSCDLDVVRHFAQLLGSAQLAKVLLEGSLLGKIGLLLNGWNGTFDDKECFV